MKRGIVLLHRDFSKETVDCLLEQKPEVVSIHLNPFQGSVDDFSCFIDENEDLIKQLVGAGITVDYRLHVVNSFLPKLTKNNEDIFRMNEKGERVNDFNVCPSSNKALKMIEDGAEKLARRLKQNSHRYHFWTDDDMGADTRCHCPKCKNKSFENQNALIYQAMLKGIKKYDEKATLSYLVYGNESIDNRPIDGFFVEFAPFLRRHDLPLTADENFKIKQVYENILKLCGGENVEVLEYFLSFDYYGFCKNGERVFKDYKFYKSTQPSLITTFLVYNKEHDLNINPLDGIKKYFSF